jgi:hypothetical protein
MDLLREKSHRNDLALDVRPDSLGALAPRGDAEHDTHDDARVQARMWQRLDGASRLAEPQLEQGHPNVEKREQQVAKVDQQAAKLEHDGVGDEADATDTAVALEADAASDDVGLLEPALGDQASAVEAKPDDGAAGTQPDTKPEDAAPELTREAAPPKQEAEDVPVDAANGAKDGAKEDPKLDKKGAKAEANAAGKREGDEDQALDAATSAANGRVGLGDSAEQSRPAGLDEHADDMARDAERAGDADPRGAARPQVQDHTAAIEQFALNDEDSDAAVPMPASKLGDDAAIESLPENLRDQAQLDSVVTQRRALIETDAAQREAELESTAQAKQKATNGEQKRQAVQAHGQRAASVQRESLSKAKGKKVATKEELRAKITNAADAEKSKLDASFATKQAELDGKLQKRLQQLLDEQVKQDERLLKELDKRLVKLEKGIADRKAAHDKQIAKEKVELEKQDAIAQNDVRATAKADADKIKAEASAQADETQRNAEKRAADTFSSGESEAKSAATTGETKAQQAIDAAEARAKSLDGDEAAKVRKEGQSRAASARGTAATRAASIRAKAKLDTAQLRATGRSDRATQIAKGGERAEQAIKNGENQAAKVHAKALEQIAAMQAKSDAAVKAMEDEVEKMRAEVDQKRADIQEKAAKARAEVEAKIDDEKTKALEAMEKERDKAVAAIDAKVTTNLAKVDTASSKDLAKLEQAIERDIKEIERAVKRAEQNIETKIRAADRRVAAAVAQKKAQVKADTTRLVCSLDRMAARTRQRIREADKHTAKDIKAAQLAGLAELDAASQQADADLAAANGKLLQATTDQGVQARAAADKFANESMSAMKGQHKDLAKDINKEWVDDAVTKANKKLDDDGVFNYVSDGEAIDAMNILNSLPDEVQGDAIKQLDEAAFANLLDEVPKERREEFKSLVDNTTDPERKLDLWGEYHKSMAHNDAERRGDKYLAKIANETDKEVDEEVKWLKEAKKGNLTEDMVKHLMRRKTLEHDIEARHRVNLTNERGTRTEGPDAGRKIVWTEEELRELDATLKKLPDSHVRNNTSLKEIRREDFDEDTKDFFSPTGFGDHSKGRIRVYDHGARLSPDLDNQEADGTATSILATTVVHEIGHNIHDLKGESFEEFKKTAWEEDLGEKELKKRGLTAKEIADMKGDGNGPGKPVEKDGKVYTYRYGKFQAKDEDAFPTGSKWSFAKNNPKDHFAEMYMMANLTPQQFEQDMLIEPAAAVTRQAAVVEAFKTAVSAAEAELANKLSQDPPATAEDIQNAKDAVTQRKKDLAEQVAELKKRKSVQTAKANQYRIVRELVDEKR